MKDKIKSVLRTLLVKIPFKVTQNQYYDYCTNRIIRERLEKNSNCIDVGCHKGEVMDEIIKAAPYGLHYGFEPIPDLFNLLASKYKGRNVKILPYALDEKSGGHSNFNYVISNPSYSGLKKRSYDFKGEVDKEISVEIKALDDCVDTNISFSLIKIDVEGGEYGVLSGAQRILEESKPLLIFEHGIGGSDHYGTTPEMIYDFLNKFGYKIYLLPDFIKSKSPINKSTFEKQFYKKLNYYFVAE